MVLDYNPILRDIQKVIKKHFYLLQPSPEVKEIFPSKSIFAAYRRTKILKEMLAPSKFRLTSSRNQIEENRGCSKCDMKCDLCKNYLIQASKFQSSATGRQYPIQQGLSCSSLQYVGSTSTEFKVTFRNHKSNMLKNKRTCELAIHFHDSEYEITQINFIIIEQIRSLENSLHLERLLLTREAYWTAQLFTLNPHGLNKRREFRSKHRINYHNWVVVICHFSNMTYFILILLHYHFWYLFIPEFKGSFQGFCYVFHQFFIKKGGLGGGVIATVWWLFPGILLWFLLDYIHSEAFNEELVTPEETQLIKLDSFFFFPLVFVTCLYSPYLYSHFIHSSFFAFHRLTLLSL